MWLSNRALPWICGMCWFSSSTSSKSLGVDCRPSWNYRLQISPPWLSGSRSSSFPSCPHAIHRALRRTCIIPSVIVQTWQEGKGELTAVAPRVTIGIVSSGFFVVWMRWHVILLEFVSKTHWTIEKSCLEELNKTWVEVDLDVGQGTFGHPDRLKERSQSNIKKEKKKHTLSSLSTAQCPGYMYTSFLSNVWTCCKHSLQMPSWKIAI